MSSALTNSTVFEANPYEGHPNLSELEAEVLWQYAKLSQNIKEVCSLRHISREYESHRMRSLLQKHGALAKPQMRSC